MLLSVGGQVSDHFPAFSSECRERLLIVGMTTWRETWSACRCDVVVPVAPSVDADAFARDIAVALRVHRPIVAFPCRDADMRGMARVKADDPALGAPLLVDSVVLAKAMSDRVLMQGFMERCRLPIPATAWTFEGALEFAARHGFPLIAKQRFGSGTKGVNVVLNDEQLRCYALHGDFDMQPLILPLPGFAAGLPGLCFGVPFRQRSGFTELAVLQGLAGRDGDLVHLMKVDAVHRFGRPHR